MIFFDANNISAYQLHCININAFNSYIINACVPSSVREVKQTFHGRYYYRSGTWKLPLQTLNTYISIYIGSIRFTNAHVTCHHVAKYLHAYLSYFNVIHILKHGYFKIKNSSLQYCWKQTLLSLNLYNRSTIMFCHLPNPLYIVFTSCPPKRTWPAIYH